MEAIHRAAQAKPDLILMDASMPNMNGIEAASRLKKMLPGVCIIVFTIFDDSLGSALTSMVGMDLVVAKTDGLTHLMEGRLKLQTSRGHDKE